jgi:hypothetical protein
MEIPILNGVYVDADPRFRTLYPVNLAPVPVQTGISNSYLKPAEGMVAEAVGLGVDRGGINCERHLLPGVGFQADHCRRR